MKLILFGGMDKLIDCWKCFCLRCPDVAKEMRAKRVSKEKTHSCAHCNNARPQLSHPSTKLRYCRVCFRTQFPQLAADVDFRRRERESTSGKLGSRGRNGRAKHDQCQGYCWKCFGWRCCGEAEETRAKRVAKRELQFCAHCSNVLPQLT